jgi:hypothetical protein
MKRRTYLQTMLAAGAALYAAAPEMEAQASSNPIVLYVDLSVDPAKEKLMLKNFHEIFKPAAIKFEGYIDVKIAKLRQTLMGTAPAAGINYRFELTYKSEELRQKWVASAVHQKAWPTIENTLTTKNYSVLLCDLV